jgi:hypothetical protein
MLANGSALLDVLPPYRLTTNFAYVPLTQPEPPSALRQLAYKEGSDLIGPEGDPAGWKVLQPVKFKGKLFATVDVEMECTVCPPKCRHPSKTLLKPSYSLLLQSQYVTLLNKSQAPRLCANSLHTRSAHLYR